MKKLAIIFGGSGYIGSHLVEKLTEEKIFDQIMVCDIVGPKFCLEAHSRENVDFMRCDVRLPIELSLPKLDKDNSFIFNFAAIHREPGHEYKEYFDTNIPGAENVIEYARRTGIKNILFTSSIAPYGRSMEERTEESNLYPETAYGISKALAEQIHQKWLAEDETRRLIIVRPSVIFGPKDPGNVYRMVKGIKGGTFILPNGGKIIKAYGYVYGLVESMLYVMDQKEKRLVIYNYAENPLVPLNEMVGIVKDEFGYKKWVPNVPTKLLMIVAFFLQGALKLFGKKTDIHPVRVKKAGFPTSIRPQYLIDSKFEFNYDFRTALKHWKTISPEDFE